MDCIACQAPLSMGFSRQECWSGLPCPSLGTMGYYSAIKINKILPFAEIWMDLESIILSELSQTEKDFVFLFNILFNITYMWDLKEYKN